VAPSWSKAHAVASDGAIIPDLLAQVLRLAQFALLGSLANDVTDVQYGASQLHGTERYRSDPP
jgi:hypothetical protein